MTPSERHASQEPIEKLLSEKREIIKTGENTDRLKEIQKKIDWFNYGIRPEVNSV